MTKIFTKIGATLYDNSLYGVPSDRTFRSAWDHPDAGAAPLKVDMVKARDIWRDKIRAARKPQLEALDAEFMVALEKGQPTQAIAAKKQALRDATADPRIEQAQTPEELKGVQPAGLEVY